MNRKACGTGDLTLSAIYPLLPQDGNEPAWRDIAMPVDQSGAAEYEAADVLFASTEVGASSASAVLKFNHALHRINIHLKGNIPDDLTIEVKSLAGGRISLEDGTVKADGDAGFVWLKPYRQGSASYSIIILPQATEAFRGEYGDLKRPEKYTRMTPENQQHSEVFNFFKSSFGNQGSWDTGGVNWFINGNDKNLIYCRLPEFHGFFSRVFSEDDTIATETRDTSKDNFNRWIKDAFRKNRAICFTAFNFAGPNTKRHSMVIWGAEFDAEGIVSNVYFCDNNYGEDEPNHGSLRRYKVEYLLSDVPEHQGKEFAYLVQQDYTDGTKPTARAEFTSLTLVDLRRDIWQKAFPEETMNNE